MVLTAENEAAAVAARWAVGLIAPRGEFRLVLVMEREMHENVAALMQSIAPDMGLSADSLSPCFGSQLHATASGTPKGGRRD